MTTNDVMIIVLLISNVMGIIAYFLLEVRYDELKASAEAKEKRVAYLEGMINELSEKGEGDG